MEVWGHGPRDSTKGEGRVRVTRRASSWASLDCESGFWLYTAGRWGRSDESAGGRISRPRNEMRENSHYGCVPTINMFTLIYVDMLD